MVYGEIYNELKKNTEYKAIISVPMDEIVIESQGQYLGKINMHGTEPSKKEYVYVAIGGSKHEFSGRIKVGTGSANKIANFKDKSKFSEFYYDSGELNYAKGPHTPTNQEYAVADAVYKRYKPLIDSNANGKLGNDEFRTILLVDRPNLGKDTPVVPVKVNGKQWYADYNPAMGNIGNIAKMPLLDVDPSDAYPIPDEIPKK